MKLIVLATGATVSASRNGADILVARGTHAYADTAPPPPSAAGFVWPDTHAALDQFAADHDFEWPAPAEGKKRLTIDEKIAALEAAGHTPE